MFSKIIVATLLAVAAADANGSHLVNDDVDVVTERSCPVDYNSDPSATLTLKEHFDMTVADNWDGDHAGDPTNTMTVATTSTCIGCTHETVTWQTSVRRWVPHRRCNSQCRTSGSRMGQCAQTSRRRRRWRNCYTEEVSRTDHLGATGVCDIVQAAHRQGNQMWRVSGSAYNNNLAAAANSPYTSQDDEKFCTLSTAEEFQYPDQECKAEVFLQEIGDLESNDKTCISIAAGGETVTRQCIGDDFGAGILETDWFSGSELFSVELAAMTSIPTERIYHDDVKITCRSCKAPKTCPRNLEDKAIHWAEKDATGSWGPYLSVHPSTEAECQTACEANADCRGWSYRYGNPNHGHFEKCFLLDAAHVGYGAKGSEGDFHSSICADTAACTSTCEIVDSKIIVSHGLVPSHTHHRCYQMSAPSAAVAGSSDYDTLCTCDCMDL